MKTEKKAARLTFNGEDLIISTASYAGSRAMAVVAQCADGEPYAKVSTNLDELPAPNCFWLKDWSENEPLAGALIAAGVIELTGRAVPSGFVTVKEARFRRSEGEAR